jgi:NADH:ubiquinone oxidoreductase subunit 3 (subunit A)
MKAKTISLSVIFSALFLTLAVITMIVTLSLKHARDRQLRLVSYPCIVVKGDKWVSRVDLEMRYYYAWLRDDSSKGRDSVQR